jgi:acyl-CoA dehydrogenase
MSASPAALDAAELDAFRASARRFVEREIAPHVAAWDEAETFPAPSTPRPRRPG